MKPDKLRQYVTLRESLMKEKTALEARLREINKALGQEGATSAARVTVIARPMRKRAKNPMSLRAAVVQVTKDKPMAKPEILAAIKKIGYVFTAKDPVNSLNTVLYSGKTFKNQGGKFSPA